jgi:hypothetical protein
MTRAEAPDSGNYEVLKRRLDDLATDLQGRVAGLNEARQKTFGGSEMALIGAERIRTENNCVPVDIVALGDHLLVGYNLFLGLKSDYAVRDIFALYRLETRSDGFEFHEVDPDAVDPGLFAGESFKREFDELRRYYKDARLVQLRAGSKLLAVFQVGATHRDVRVLRWSLTPDGQATYVDNRGERDHVYPASHSFQWTRATRDDQRRGRFPHVSIRDKVFVETTGGDLTIKVEDNTETGLGVYTEPVDDRNQSLDDAEIHHAEVGVLILLKIKPFREERFRYLVFNTRSRTAMRIDAIGQSCIALPEDQGLLFPGGYYLQTGEHRLFDVDTQELEFKRQLRSPNGEDVLYVFHQRARGHYLLFPYNLIRREVATPIPCDGFSLFGDGRMVVLRHVSAEASRVHPVQLWQTPFTSDDFAANRPPDGSFLGRIGNAELVRGISECLAIVARVRNQSPTRARYEDLVAHLTRTLDAFHWLGRGDCAPIGELLAQLRRNTEQIVDEFEKVLAFRARAAESLGEAKKKLAELERGLDVEHWQDAARFMAAMDGLRAFRGQVAMLRDVRAIDLEALDVLDKRAGEHFEKVARAAIAFLADPKALVPLRTRLEASLAEIGRKARVRELLEMGQDLDAQGRGLELLTETVATLPVDDPTVKTAILDGLSEVFGQLNRVRAEFTNRRKELAAAEDRAEFAAQFRLLGQAVASAVALAETPEACDAAMSRLMVQVEELEGRFAETDAFVAELTQKREEIHTSLTTRKQALVDARQRRAQNLFVAGQRILDGVARRVAGFKDEAELNGYFAADPMLMKLRQLAEELEGLGDTVRAGELSGRLKAAQQNGLRGLRDRLELFDGDDRAVRFGTHRFTINEQPLELTVVPRDDGLYLHITGTDFHEALPDGGDAAARAALAQPLPSENADIARAEFLAGSLLLDAERGEGPLRLDDPTAWSHAALTTLVREAASHRYHEGYERGVHDDDAVRLLEALLQMRQTAGLLRFPADARALAVWWLGRHRDDPVVLAQMAEARSLAQLARRQPGPAERAFEALAKVLAAPIAAFAETLLHPTMTPAAAPLAAAYLVREMMAPELAIETAHDAVELVTRAERLHPNLAAELAELAAHPASALRLAGVWVEAASADLARPELAPHGAEAAVLLLTGATVPRRTHKATLEKVIEGLMSQHPRILERRLVVRLDAFLARIEAYRTHTLPAWQAQRARVQRHVEQRRRELRLEGLKPNVLTSFVRNRLLNEVYLPLIGANLAKQIGAAGAKRRTDLMGLLLLISPPGYGKTTLMEYVASRLGLAFVKINGPSLGHAVTSLDPAEAPNATARQEIVKLNLALEMGNNTMLLIDDIQHTHPEFLQKFISLCDGTRRIDGVWNGAAKTHDLRGKRFCIVMAGNPYTESGESFRIPDMLANRADIYNLGDILEGKRDAFALSYLENALTSNSVLAPLATRAQSDVYKLVAMARGEAVSSTDLEHGYAAAELSEILGVLKHLLRAQEVLLAVNQRYIASAATNDAYRTEPPFKLQGSYRNMNKLAEKVVAALTPDELERIIDDHYLGEAQTLTTGAEANLLKLKELRGRLSDAERQRWLDIQQEFVRRNQLGGDGEDPASRVAGQLSLMQTALQAIRTTLADAASSPRTAETTSAPLVEILARLESLLAERLRESPGVPVAPDLQPITRGLDMIAASLREKAQSPPPVPAAPAPRRAPPAAVPSNPAADDFTRFLGQQGRLVDEAIVPMARAASQNLEENTRLTRELLNLIARLEQVDTRS